jgi:hypothetical protein
MRKEIVKKIIVSLMFCLVIVILLAQPGLSLIKDPIPLEKTDIVFTVSNVDKYDFYTEFYSKRNSIPKDVFQSLIGSLNRGMFDSSKPYSSDGTIGVAHLLPVDNTNSIIHYQMCIDSGCGFTDFTGFSSLDLNDKQALIKDEYSNVDNSVCCASYILNELYSLGDLDYPPASCSKRTQVVYKEWNATLRRFIGENSCDDDDLFFVEKANQLRQVFNQYRIIDTSSTGILKFTPSFSIKVPEIVEVYDALPDFIRDVQTAKSEQEVITKMSAFEKNNNVEFGYCEDSKVNVIDSFYDRLVGAFDSDETSCKYLLASSEPELEPMSTTFLHLDYNPSLSLLELSNNLPGVFERNYALTIPISLNVRFDVNILIKSTNFGNDYEMQSQSGIIMQDFNKVYLLKKPLPEVSEFIFAKPVVTGGYEYYNSSGDLVDGDTIPICTKKYKYFACLDTKKYVEEYDWTLGKWVIPIDAIVDFSIKSQGKSEFGAKTIIDNSPIDYNSAIPQEINTAVLAYVNNGFDISKFVGTLDLVKLYDEGYLYKNYKSLDDSGVDVSSDLRYEFLQNRYDFLSTFDVDYGLNAMACFHALTQLSPETIDYILADLAIANFYQVEYLSSIETVKVKFAFAIPKTP